MKLLFPPVLLTGRLLLYCCGEAPATFVVSARKITSESWISGCCQLSCILEGRGKEFKVSVVH